MSFAIPEPYTWDSSFDVKNDELNEQHKKLFTLIAELAANKSDAAKLHTAKTAALVQGIGLSVKVGGSVTDHSPLGQRGNGNNTISSSSATNAPPPQIVSRRRSKTALARGYNSDAGTNPYDFLN